MYLQWIKSTLLSGTGDEGPRDQFAENEAIPMQWGIPLGPVLLRRRQGNVHSC